MLCVLPLVGLASTWTLVCGGDVMLNSIAAKTNPFAAIASKVKSADLAYANLEVPLTTARAATPRKTPEQLARRSQFVLKGDPTHAKHLATTGFDIVSLANNHAMDFRKEGLAQMVAAIEKQGIGHSGSGLNLDAALEPVVREVRGLKVGMISFMSFVDKSSNWATTPATESEPGIAVLDFGGKMDAEKQGQVKKLVRNAKRKCDFLLVAVHWGVERTTVPTRYQVSLGRGFIDAGADVVIGAHPHRLQGGEIYKGKPILYSMGNLISPLPGETGLATLRFDGERYVSAEFFPVRIAGGKTTPYTGKTQQAQLEKFRKLCDEVQRKFPSPRSSSLFPGSTKP
ncbi:MAG: CapA family protein [Fimbriimonadaceae bacterium]|nr:CapA family protein [Fimbriimonadaceae bacterium]